MIGTISVKENMLTCISLSRSNLRLASTKTSSTSSHDSCTGITARTHSPASGTDGKHQNTRLALFCFKITLLSRLAVSKLDVLITFLFLSFSSSVVSIYYFLPTIQKSYESTFNISSIKIEIAGGLNGWRCTNLRGGGPYTILLLVPYS